MKLRQFSSRVYYTPGEERTDRPWLFYLRGDRASLAVDAGNSPAHVRDFYAALTEAGLPLPRYTVITHWHWDHTFGISEAQGTVIAGRLTNAKLREVADWVWTREAMEQRLKTGEDILFCHTRIPEEYPDLSEIRVVPAPVTLDGTLELDLGGLTCRVFAHDSTHSRDSVFIHAPEAGVLALGDAWCGDFYGLDGAYDPERTAAFLTFLRELDFQTALFGHDEPMTKAAVLEILETELENLKSNH